jgi:hypothetical protein
LKNKVADRFWIGDGTSTDWSNTDNWSTTDGESGGASVPTSSDDVYFTSTAVGNCTLTTTSNCKTLSFTGGTGYTGTFSQNTRVIAMYGNLTLFSGMTYTATGNAQIRFYANANLTSNGIQIPTYIDWGANIIITLQDDLDCSFMTGSTGTVRALNPNEKNVTFSNVTTSQKTITTVTGNFNNFTIISAVAITGITFYSNIVVNGTLTINGNSSTNRFLICSDTLGTQRTITTATVSCSNVDFRDIKGAGAGDWDLSSITGLSGDCGGNEDITFTTGISCYYVGGGANGNWSDSAKWFTASGGATGARVPLPQDTAIIDTNSFTGSRTLTQDMPRIPNVNFTGSTDVTWTTSTVCEVYGSINLTDLSTLTASTQTYTFCGRGTHTITSAGKTWDKSFIIDCVGGSYTLQDDFIIDSATRGVTLTSGEFDLNNFNYTAGLIQSNNSNNRTLKLGSGTITLNNDTINILNLAVVTNLTFNAGTSLIKIISNFTGDRITNLGGLTFYNFENASSGSSLIIRGNNTFNNFKVNAGLTQLFYRGNTQTVTTFEAIGTSGNEITLQSDTTSTATLTKAGGGTIEVEYCDISYLTATPSTTWYANNSTDSGNNTGWTFSSPPTPEGWNNKIMGITPAKVNNILINNISKINGV